MTVEVQLELWEEVADLNVEYAVTGVYHEETSETPREWSEIKIISVVDNDGVCRYDDLDNEDMEYIVVKCYDDLDNLGD